MSRKFWEMTEAAIAADPEAAQARYDAYFRTFMATDEGRKVLADLRRDASRASRKGAYTGTEKHLILAGVDWLLGCIRYRCGLRDELTVIEAEAGVARDYTVPPPPKKPSSIYDEQEMKENL